MEFIIKMNYYCYFFFKNFFTKGLKKTLMGKSQCAQSVAMSVIYSYTRNSIDVGECERGGGER